LGKRKNNSSLQNKTRKMAKLESSFKNMVLALTGITLIAALALGSMYELTKAPIEASRKAKQENAIKDVLPAFERIDAAQAIEIEGLGSFNVFKAFDANNEFVGAAVESFSKNGFSGEIKIMVGFDKSGTIVNYSVLNQKETPGLGTKIVDWFKTDKNKQNINGLHPNNAKLMVSKDGGEIDAITAATISSRAFLEAVQNAYDAFAKTNSEAGNTVTNLSLGNDTANDSTTVIN
jgi:electron transport complex protein RnfG